MASSSETQAYLQPKTKNPKSKVQRKDGMFVNQPNYPELGGLTGPSKLNKSGMESAMHLEKGGPTAQRGKPI